MSGNDIPQSDSIRQLAQFWDTHDVTAFEDQLEEVTQPVFRRASVMHVRLAAEEVAAVEAMAQAQGLAAAELISQWVREKIHAA